MRALLVYPNTNRMLAPPPIGLAYLAAALRARGHEPVLCDLMFAGDPAVAYRRSLDAARPDAVGFSVRNLDDQSPEGAGSPLPFVRELVGEARRRGLPTILGGPAFTTFPRAMLEYLAADFGIAGQGEAGLPPLLDALSRGDAPSGIPGLVRRTDAGMAAPPVITGYAGVPVDWAFLDMRRYRRTYIPPFASVVVKTGCPYQCAFCDAGVTMGNAFQFRDPAEIVADIRAQRRLFGVDTFFLIDPCFNAPLDRAKTLLESLVRARLGIRFLTTIKPVRGAYDDEFFALFRRAGGCFTILGTDSLSPAMIASYRLPFSIDDVFTCAALLERHGIRYGLEPLFGGPGETESTIRETMATLPRLGFSLFLWHFGLRVLPGAAIAGDAQRLGIFRDDAELLFPLFYVSPDLDLAWARGFVEREASRYASRRLRMLPLLLRSTVRRLVWHGL